MIKYVIEAQNIYSKGHEQMNKRPYLVIYDSNDYILGFPTTTKNKKSKQYPSLILFILFIIFLNFYILTNGL